MSREDSETDEWSMNEDARRSRKPVLRGEYNADLEEILSEVRSLQNRMRTLERKLKEDECPRCRCERL